MTTISNQNEHNSILKSLNSNDPLVVVETIEKLRTIGKISDIPVLIELLHTSQDKEVRAKISNLLATLKDIDAIPFLIEAILDLKYVQELKELVSACWENGLDYSTYLSLFVDMLIEKDFIIAFEAYTVLMNMESKIDQEKIDQEIDKLQKSLSSADEQKRILLLDVIDYLPSIGS